jgi:hypothetical protein
MSTPNFINPEEYNNLTLATEEGSECVPPDIIRKAGDIILRHGLQTQFGVTLLHRHFEMPPDSIAVKSTLSDDIDVMRFLKVTEIDSTQIRGFAFKLTPDKQFQAYEYSTDPDVAFEIPEAFRDDMIELFTDSGLEDTLGLCCRSKPELGVELNIWARKISIRLPMQEMDGHEMTLSPMGWLFATGQSESPDPELIECEHSEHPGENTDSDVELPPYFPVLQAALQKFGVHIPELED